MFLRNLLLAGAVILLGSGSVVFGYTLGGSINNADTAPDMSKDLWIYILSSGPSSAASATESGTGREYGYLAWSVMIAQSGTDSAVGAHNVNSTGTSDHKGLLTWTGGSGSSGTWNIKAKYKFQVYTNVATSTVTGTGVYSGIHNHAVLSAKVTVAGTTWTHSNPPSWLEVLVGNDSIPDATTSTTTTHADTYQGTPPDVELEVELYSTGNFDGQNLQPGPGSHAHSGGTMSGGYMTLYKPWK